MNKIITEDLQAIANNPCVPWEHLRHQTLLITGASGLIGKNLIQALLYTNRIFHLELTLLALVRKPTQLKDEFSDDRTLKIIEGSVESLPQIDEKIDYIIHGASPTASTYFISNPVETIHTIVFGTNNILKLALNNKIKKFVYLSSMEVYGRIGIEHLIHEQDLGYLDPLSVRNCYPISKYTCENLCACYYKQYQVPTVSVRLAQTFGPGVSYKDMRVFAMIARCAINGENIVLNTKGESKHSYLYTADAVTGVLCALLKGKSGAVYNLANPSTYCSIYEMAQLVANKLTNNKILVQTIEGKDISKYPAPSFLNLDITAIRKLGWKPNIGLLDMYKRMIASMKGVNE